MSSTGKYVTYIGGEIPWYLRKGFCFLDATYNFQDQSDASCDLEGGILVTGSSWLAWSENLASLDHLPNGSVLLNLERRTDLSLALEVFVSDFVSEEMDELDLITRLGKHVRGRERSFVTTDPVSDPWRGRVLELGFIGKEVDVASYLLGVPDLVPRDSVEVARACWGEGVDQGRVKYVIRRVNARLRSLGLATRVTHRRGVGWSFSDEGFFNLVVSEPGG